MAREIENYQDLQDEIIGWLNRADLAERIPTFIYLAERKIFRRLRIPSNEKTVTYNMKEDPQYDSAAGSTSTDIPIEDNFPLPGDYLEASTLQQNGKPMDRVSLTELQNRVYATDGLAGPPKIFARERRIMRIYPTPDGDTILRLIYYADLSGNLVEADDDNNVLWIAPDLYLYGALMQATPWIKPDDLEFRLIPVWKNAYEEGFAEIEFQRDEDERSGSNVQVKSAYHDGPLTRRRH